MRNLKVWVSALVMVIAMSCGGSGGELSNAEVDDIYDICSTKSKEASGSYSPRGLCVRAAGWLLAAHDQGGSCDFRSIVATLHSGSGLSQSQIEKKHCPMPQPDRRPLYQQISDWFEDGATQRGMVLVTVVVIGVALLRERWQEKHPPGGK